MKKILLKSLLVSFGLFFIPLIQTAIPREGFGHMGTGPTTEQHHDSPENRLSQEALQMRLAEGQRLLTQKHLTQDPLLPHLKIDNPEGTSLLLIPKGRDATTEELAALERERVHRFTLSPAKAYAADHHTPLDAIRTKIIQHLTNELAAIKSKLAPEEIKNREMVIKFFDKAGELTRENLIRFHTIYKKLAEWDRASELTLTPEEQKEMKLFLQSIITTYCAKHQTVAQ